MNLLLRKLFILTLAFPCIIWACNGRIIEKNIIGYFSHKENPKNDTIANIDIKSTIRCDTCIYLSDSTEVRSFVAEVQKTALSGDTAKFMLFFEYPFNVDFKFYNSPEDLRRNPDWTLMYNDIKRQPILFFEAYPNNLDEYTAANIYDLDLWNGGNNNDKFNINICCWITLFTTRSREGRSESLSHFRIERRNGELKLVYVTFAG